MRDALPFLFMLLLTKISAAQTTETIKVTAGNDVSAAVSEYGIYRLPAFVNGTVYFKDGKLGKERMNYNILNAQVMYIDKKGDTLAIASPEEIQKTDLNGVVFYYEKNDWLEVIADAATASLALKRRVNIRYEKKGAFGLSNSTADIDSYNSYNSDHASYKLYVADDASVTRVSSYFLLTKDGRVLPAAKNSFLRYFTQNRKDLESYLSDNKINFNNAADLMQLLRIGAYGKSMP